jgi:predicted amidohydrolase YtcJ
MTRVALVVLVLSIASVLSAAAQAPETVLVNGKIVTLDARSSVQEALAIRDGKIAALGRSVDVRKLAGPATRIVDLGGRTVIPGLIDSHLHAVRAALSFTSEVNWIGARSLSEALARIGAAARAREPGAWLIVAGGWNELQFAERRRPTQAELEAAAPGSPVYVQLGYGWALLTDAGLAKLGIKSDADVPAGGKLERDASGKPTGAITGGNNAIVALFDRLPRPTYAQQVEGTKAFFRELNRLALTGVVDPGGNNLFPSDYQALFDVWRRHEMTVRVAYSLNGQTAGHEREELAQLTELLPMGFGDEYLKFNGIGERNHARDEQQPEPKRSGQGKLLPNREVGSRARARPHDALGARCNGRSPARHLRARESRRTDQTAALVDRASQRRVRAESQADGRPRRRLDGARRDVLRR